MNIEARNIISFDGVEQIKLTGLPNGVFSRVTENAVGSGGSINIRSGVLSITNGAQLNASSEGNGPAGNLKVSARSIRLDNKAALRSETIAGQGDITLDSQNLILSQGSNITTNAQGTATGGNIAIDTGVLTTLENSDISANAEAATGGQVEIDAQSIFRSPDSDITASSDLGLEFSGTVEINTPDVDPSKGVAKQPNTPVNVTVTQGCQVSSGEASVKFFNTGKGGLAPNPYEPLSSNQTWEDVPYRTEPSARVIRASEPLSPSNKIVEAQGWLTNEKGEAVLVAEVPTPSSQRHCHLR